MVSLLFSEQLVRSHMYIIYIYIYTRSFIYLCYVYSSCQILGKRLYRQHARKFLSSHNPLQKTLFKSFVSVGSSSSNGIQSKSRSRSFSNSSSIFQKPSLQPSRHSRQNSHGYIRRASVGSNGFNNPNNPNNSTHQILLAVTVANLPPFKSMMRQRMPCIQLYQRVSATDDYVFVAKTETAKTLTSYTFQEKLPLQYMANREQEIALVLSYDEGTQVKFQVGYVFTSVPRLVHWAFTSFSYKLTNPGPPCHLSLFLSLYIYMSLSHYSLIGLPTQVDHVLLFSYF